MKKNSKQLLEETQKLQVKNKELHTLLKQNMLKAKDTIELIKKGQIDALVIPDKNGLKIYTEKTADKTYRILIEKMHEGAVTISKVGTILYCNSSFAGMVNQPLQKVIGSRFENFIENASKKLFKTLVKRGWDGYASEELSLVANVGTVIPALLSITGLKIDDKIILSVIITDISLRKKNERDIRYLASIVESSDDAIITKSLNGIIKSWNKGSVKLFGYTAEEAIGKNILLIIPKEHVQEEKEIIRRIRNNETVHYETIRKHKTGKQFYVSITVSPLKDEAGNIVGASKIARDITAQKNNEAGLIQTNKKLIIQIEENEKQARELGIANKDLTTLTFVSSHDLQEPLRKIKNFASVLLEEETKKLSDDGKKYLQKIYESANGMQTLIEDLLVYARSKDPAGEFKKTKLSTIVEEVKKNFEDVIQEKKAIIEVHQLCETKIIWFQFRQLMYNLISNSLKFAKPGIPPHIIIKSEIKHGSKLKNEKLSRDLDYCHISLTDNGIGFDPQYNDRIFGVFQRLHSKDEYAGTGIGLAIVKRIVENHKGAITATGKLNKGARFDIYLPVK